MGTTKKFDEMTTWLNVKLRKCLVSYGEYKNIRAKWNQIEKVSLTEAQENEVEAFFRKNYGKKVPTHWHRLYMSYMGKFCHDYFPEFLFSTRLEPMMNPYKTAALLGDKNLLPVLFANIDGVRVPRTYISRVRGIYRDGDGHCIAKGEAIERFSRYRSFCIKKTVDTSSGRDVAIYTDDPEQAIDYGKLTESFGTDFVVQELIKQQDDVSALNATSINTFRVMSYICDGKVHVCPIALRIGRDGKKYDNIHAGGISIGVREDGSLREYAFAEYGERYDRHPDSGIEFKTHRIANVDKLKSAAVKLHERLPWLGILSWDLVIGQDGFVYVLEVNTTGQSAWFCQYVNGESLFGKNTAEMLKMIRK